MKLSVLAILFAVPLAGCVSLQEQQDGGQNLSIPLPWRQGQKTTGAAARQTIYRNELLKQELIFAKNLRAQFEMSLPSARAIIATTPVIDRTTMSANQRFDTMVFIAPAKARNLPIWAELSKSINDFARALATNRGSAELEMAMQPQSAKRSRFEATPASIVNVEDGGQLTLVKRTDSAVPQDALRITIAARPVD